MDQSELLASCVEWTTKNTRERTHEIANMNLAAIGAGEAGQYIFDHCHAFCLRAAHV